MEKGQIVLECRERVINFNPCDTICTSYTVLLLGWRHDMYITLRIGPEA